MRSSLKTLLLLPIGFTVSLLLFRIVYTQSLFYAFLAWNLVLAVVPLILSSFLIRSSGKQSGLILFMLWLLFFPNASYIITDLIHLHERNGVPLWFDIMLIFSAAMNGLIISFASLYQVEKYLRSRFSNQQSALVLSACIFLSSFGIYLGRFLRYNSWDLFTSPTLLGSEIVAHLLNPFHHSRTWSVTITFSLFSLIFYYVVKRIPTLIMTPQQLGNFSV